MKKKQTRKKEHDILRKLQKHRNFSSKGQVSWTPREGACVFIIFRICKCHCNEFLQLGQYQAFDADDQVLMTLYFLIH